MPRLNEGLQNVVRTHAIFSPTEPSMIESNHPNACNLCHTDRPIDWTLTHLNDWYGASYSEERIALSYPLRGESASVGWLKSENEAVRLIATDAIARTNNHALVGPLLEILDDEFLLNRQFAMIALEDLLDISLKEYGYKFYMTPLERRNPIRRLRDSLDLGERIKAKAGAISADQPQDQ